MIEKLRWVQVSDFHFIAAGDTFSQDHACRALLDDLQPRVPDGEPIAFVLVTGDIAFSGQPAEYARATTFLVELASILQVPRDRFYFVPGNHDVDRTKSRLAYAGACSTLTSQAEVDLLLGNPGDLAPLIDRQSAFRKFVDDFVGAQDRAQTEDGLGYVARMVIGDLRLSILCLNSAWLSGRNEEEARLLIGERQIINALELASPYRPHFQIALAHHPISWLMEWDQVSCNNRLLPSVDFYQRGHLHRDEVALSSTPERPCLSIAAGSSHATRFYANSYNIVEMDIGAGKSVVRPFRYDPGNNSFSPVPEVSAPVSLTRSISGDSDGFTACLEASIPSAAVFGTYLWDLIVGRKVEIPYRLADGVEFCTPALAEAMGGERSEPVARFLRLPNLLGLYDDDIPLSVRVESHATTIADFAAYLSELSALDAACGKRISNSETAATRRASPSQEGDQPYTFQFLTDLHDSGAWTLLRDQARRFVDSPDRNLSHLARSLLAQALMHSDQTEEKEQALGLALELARSENATAEDYLLAAGCSEVLGDDDGAIAFAEQALTAWPNDPACRIYGRDLASRTGSHSLRDAVWAAQGGSSS